MHIHYTAVVVFAIALLCSGAQQGIAQSPVASTTGGAITQSQSAGTIVAGGTIPTLQQPVAVRPAAAVIVVPQAKPPAAAAVKPVVLPVPPPQQCQDDLEWAGGSEPVYGKSPCAFVCPVSIITGGAASSKSVNVEYTDPRAAKQRPEMVAWCKEHVAHLNNNNN